MPFDPSILSEIGGYGPNPVKAQSDAYTLANQRQNVQMGGIELSEAKRSQSDDQKIREILKGADLSTFEGKTKAAQEITKISPEKGMKFMGQVQTERQQQQKYTMEELTTAAEQADQLGGALDSVATQLQAEAQKPGANPAMLDAKAKQLVIPAALRLRQANPALAQYIDKFLQDPQGLTYQGVMQAYTQSKTGRENIRNHIAEKKQEETERANRARESEADRRIAAQGAGFTPEIGQLMGALAEQGVSLPTGFRSKAQQVELYKGLMARNPEKTPDEIARLIKTGQIEFGAQKKETQTAAAVAGRVEVAQNEIEEFVPLVREAAAKIPRGQFVPVTKLLQMGEASISNPDLRALKIRINSVLNAYDMLAARGGTDKDKRADVRALLTSADSSEVLEAGLKSFELEAAAAHRAAVKATKVPELPEAASPKTSGETQTYQGKTYRLKPGADRSKRESWEVVGGG